LGRAEHLGDRDDLHPRARGRCAAHTLLLIDRPPSAPRNWAGSALGEQRLQRIPVLYDTIEEPGYEVAP